ncbi:MAG: metallophosphoesterase [Erysipelotrichaceae bacterium]|nr:metallophosphoesterase [Erysipelotrichaceae bacterium]MDY6035302.1 metallophosphoesterase [Bulleidia sp.]
MHVWIIVAVVVILGLIIFLGWPHKIDATRKKIYSSLIHHKVRICVISDLHANTFGENNERMSRIVNKHRPDLIVYPGDLFTPGANNQNGIVLMHALQQYPQVYITGNHDERLNEEELQNLFIQMRKLGVHILQDNSEIIHINGQALEVIGLTDGGKENDKTFEEVDSLCVSPEYRILLSHRPHYIDFYEQLPVNLIISGHAHGGQWVIPFTHQGIFAPQQGLFPKYTHGIKNLDGRLLYISRGLATGNKFFVRLFNNPEIGFIDLLPMRKKG